jgi:hypothetical protein
MNTPQNISDRVDWAIEFAWGITVDKIANGECKSSAQSGLKIA